MFDPFHKQIKESDELVNSIGLFVVSLQALRVDLISLSTEEHVSTEPRR